MEGVITSLRRFFACFGAARTPASKNDSVGCGINAVISSIPALISSVIEAFLLAFIAFLKTSLPQDWIAAMPITGSDKPGTERSEAARKAVKARWARAAAAAKKARQSETR